MISLGNDTMPPLWAAALRLMLAAPLLALIAWATGQRLPRGAALGPAVVYGLLNMGVGLALLYWGEREVSSGLAAVLFATIPLTQTLLTRAFGLERLTPIKVAATLVALGGVGVIFSDQIGLAVRPWPPLALLASATCAALGTVILKRGPQQSPIGANAVAAAAGLVVCLAASLLAGESHALPATMPQVFPIVYLTLLGSVVAFGLFIWLVNHWEVSRLSFISVIVPVLALGLGAAVRHERITTLALLGSTLVLGGLLLRIQSERIERGRVAPQGSTA